MYKKMHDDDVTSLCTSGTTHSTNDESVSRIAINSRAVDSYAGDALFVLLDIARLLAKTLPHSSSRYKSGLYDKDNLEHIEAAEPKDYMDPKVKRQLNQKARERHAEEEEKRREREWSEGGRRARMGIVGRKSAVSAKPKTPPTREKQPVTVVKPKSKPRRPPISKQTGGSVIMYRENPHRKTAVMFDSGYDADEQPILRRTENLKEVMKDKLSERNLIMRSAKIVEELQNEEAEAGGKTKKKNGSSADSSSEESSVPSDSNGSASADPFLAHLGDGSTTASAEDAAHFFPYFQYEKNGMAGALVSQAEHFKRRYGPSPKSWLIRLHSNRLMIPRLENTALSYLGRKIEALDMTKTRGEDPHTLEALGDWDKKVGGAGGE